MTKMETGTMASEAGPSTATTPSVPPDPLAPDDPLPTPQLDTAGLILSLDEEGKERARVRGGVMSKLARVVLFSEKIPQGEQDHFSIVPLENFKSIPPDLTALHKIPQESRRQERVFRYKGPGDSKWDSYLFARCEDGESQTCDKRCEKEISVLRRNSFTLLQTCDKRPTNEITIQCRAYQG